MTDRTFRLLVVFIPSFAQEPELQTSFPNPICPGATQSAPILHVVAGNGEGRTGVWDEPKSTFSIEVNLANSSPPGDQTVTVPAMRSPGSSRCGTAASRWTP